LEKKSHRTFMLGLSPAQGRDGNKKIKEIKAVRLLWPHLCRDPLKQNSCEKILAWSPLMRVMAAGGVASPMRQPRLAGQNRGRHFGGNMRTLDFITLGIGLLISGLLLWIFFLIVGKERRLRRSDAETSAARIRQLDSDAEASAARIQQLETRLKPITDLELETERLNGELQRRQTDIEALRVSYADKKAIYDRLIQQIAIFDEKLSFAEMGVYEPHFDFTDTEEYKKAILAVREVQKRMISDKTAVVCPKKWYINDSAAKGETMINRNIRLTLRAFNNECDVAIANVRWSNANAMEKRILNARAQIDKLNASHGILITEEFTKLKLQELFLTHEYREKLKAERDERAEKARLAREEQNLIRDMERAEEEEARYQRLLDKAKAEAQTIVGPQLDAFTDQIRILEQDLAKAHAKVLRATSTSSPTSGRSVMTL
jgi:hypothetical protein